MCTALSITNQDHYFGRTLDVEYNIIQDVVITPREFPFIFNNSKIIYTHPAIIGAGMICNDYPLYYEATNEYGLSIAGLNLPFSASFNSDPGKSYNVETYELIPWILCQCDNVCDAKELLLKTNILGNGFNTKYKASPLHWMISDKLDCITVESTRKGLQIYNNPLGILTNEPPFEFHMSNIKNYIKLTPISPQSVRWGDTEILSCSHGMGAMGLPGDLSSVSRFVRATFIKLHALYGKNEEENIGQFFHIMSSVEQIKGCVIASDGSYEKTVYTSCCNASRGIYYYTTYDNQQITAIDMNRENLDTIKLISYHMKRDQSIYYQN